MTGGSGPHLERSEGEPPPPRLLERKIALSRLALALERLWPRLWPLFAVGGLFLAVSLAGLWPLLSPLPHKLLLAAFALAALAALVPPARMRWPSRAEAIRRLERGSGVPHRPASSWQDRPAGTAADSPLAARLWQAHRERMARLFARLTVRPPTPRVDRFDPFALRALLILVLVPLLLARGGEMRARLGEAFAIADAGAATQARLDAWVTPPLYTGEPPIMLADGARPLDPGGHDARRVQVPAGSLLVIRAAGPGHRRYTVTVSDAGSSDAASTGKAAAGPTVSRKIADDLSDHQITLTGNASVHVREGGSARASWQFQVRPDKPPRIRLTKPPGRGARGSLRLTFAVEDDYGVVSAEARFALVKPKGAGAESKARPAALFDKPPVLPLRLPRANARKAEGVTFKDLTAHPWAGLTVRLTLVARDQAGQTGQSEPIVFTLPERRFSKPFARALIEQRRALVMHPTRRMRVARAIDALTIAPERFIPDKTVYLGLRSAYWRLRHDRSIGAVESVVAQLWKLALRIEDGDLSDAERALRRAQERLMSALENNASEAEISKLVKELRQALSRFLRSLSQQAQKGQPRIAPPPGLGRNQAVSPRDLDRMLKAIERMARSGARDAAQQMLSQLRNLLEQLQSGRNANAGQTRRMMQMMDRFGDLIMKQQKLMDDTFSAKRRQQGERRGEGPGRGGERRPGQRPGRSGQGNSSRAGMALGRRQGDLQGQLEKLLEGLRGLGARVPGQLEGARRAMEGARKSLKRGDLGRATQEQGLALDKLRKGSRALAEQVFRALARQFGRGARDPLGRPQRTEGPDLGTTVKVPDEIDIQRAREILEELRRRLSDQTRPPVELDYLERLLRQF